MVGFRIKVLRSHGRNPARVGFALARLYTPPRIDFRLRIAVVFKDRCQPKRCHLECIAFCPPQRTGTEVIWIDPETAKATISEETCIACGICVRKCPFDAIRIIGLPEELKDDLVHQYGKNAFRLFRLPVPKKGSVIGLLGPNGIGKTTTVGILSGETAPNLGHYRRKKPHWDEVLEYFAGTELHDYLAKISAGQLKTAIKPQYVDRLNKVYRGRVRDLLTKLDKGDRLDSLMEPLGLPSFIDRDLGQLSGGELQRVAIAATMLKDADVYFFDEPSSYLDIYQRLQVAKVIQGLAKEKYVVVVEHDLAVLDFLAETVYLMYGSEGAYGIIAEPRPVRTAINVYLGGYMKEENIRFRDREIRFESRPPRGDWKAETLVTFDALTKRYENFELTVQPGKLRKGEVVGVVGPNATGKTTFVKMLAGEETPTTGAVQGKWQVSYKPQYLESAYEGTVRELFQTAIGKKAESGYFDTEILEPLKVKGMLERDVSTLSGGELQRVAIALCLARDADIYLIDEPSAYLDSNQRMEAARTIRRIMEREARTGLIVDHDVYFIDMVSDSIMVFSGDPGHTGLGEGPFPMREGMNRFLKMVGITFRRDADTNRPRINKLDSRLDREQKGSGEYYYAVEETARVA
jgi:ATP-binding cassette subfamily E protein 1